MSEGRPPVGACACLVEGLQSSMSLDRVGSARTLMSGYAMVRFSASIPLSSSASAMTTAQMWTAGPQQQTQGRAVGFVRDVFHGMMGGFEQGSGPHVYVGATPALASRLSPQLPQNWPLQLPLQQGRWSSRTSVVSRPRHRICTSRRARRPIRAIRSASRSTTSTSRGRCRGTSTSRPCTQTRWCWSRTARRGVAAGPIRPCRPSVPSSRREAATSYSRSSCRGCLTTAGGRSTHAGGQA